MYFHNIGMVMPLFFNIWGNSLEQVALFRAEENTLKDY